MRFPSAVSLTPYPVLNYDWVPVYGSFHPYISATVPPLAPPSNMHPHLEIGPTPQWWPPGALLGKHKFTDTVVHRGLAFALEGHDLGPMIPHISIPPDNPLLVATIMGSSRKAKFTAGQVRANGKGVACCYITPYPLGKIPTPMAICSKPCALPLAGTGLASVLSSVIVGQHWIDIVADLLAIAVESAISAAISRGSSAPTSNSMGDAIGGAVMDFVAGGDPSDGAGKAALSAAPGSAGNLVRGLVRLAGQEFSDYRGPGGVNLGANFGTAEVQWSSTRDYTAEGEERWSHEGSWQVGGDGANIHGSAGAAQNEAGAYEASSSVGRGVAGNNRDLRYSDNRPADVGGGSGWYTRTEGPLVTDRNESLTGSAPSNRPDPASLPEL